MCLSIYISSESFTIKFSVFFFQLYSRLVTPQINYLQFKEVIYYYYVQVVPTIGNTNTDLSTLLGYYSFLLLSAGSS